ncbi:MAG: hemolysin III family protein [bacterium]
MINQLTEYSVREEIASSLIHGIGVGLAIAALVVMAVFSSMRGTVWHVVSCSIYGATLVLLFSASTLYHSLPWPRVKRTLKILDHSAIYLLIAGTYTPFLLGPLKGPWGWSLFGVIWGLALGGVAFKLFFAGRFKLLSTLIYVGLGWIVVVAIRPLWHSLPLGGLLWLVAGGVFYTVGTVFYLGRRIPYNHAIWHVFVLAGSLCHFFSVLLYVIPRCPG